MKDWYRINGRWVHALIDLGTLYIDGVATITNCNPNFPPPLPAAKRR